MEIIVRNEIGNDEELEYPRLMQDSDGDIWFMIYENKGFIISNGYCFEEDDFETYNLTDFKGSITLSNDK